MSRQAPAPWLPQRRPGWVATDCPRMHYEAPSNEQEKGAKMAKAHSKRSGKFIVGGVVAGSIALASSALLMIPRTALAADNGQMVDACYVTQTQVGDKDKPHKEGPAIVQVHGSDQNGEFSTAQIDEVPHNKCVLTEGNFWVGEITLVWFYPENPRGVPVPGCSVPRQLPGQNFYRCLDDGTHHP